MNTAELLPAHSDQDDQNLRLAVAAHLARYKGQTRAHTASDLKTYLSWCRDHGLEPLQAKRAHVELFLRWIQEVRRLKPSTVSRRLSVLSGFYRTCVIDEVLEHSPAEYVRRPRVAPESPTLGLSHLQFEAMLAAGRDSSNVNDFALVAMLGLLGLRLLSGSSVGAGRGVRSPHARSGPNPRGGPGLIVVSRDQRAQLFTRSVEESRATKWLRGGCLPSWVHCSRAVNASRKQGSIGRSRPGNSP
jgi:hypothetical protein